MNDLISRQLVIEELKSIRKLFCDNTPESFARLSYGDKCKVDEIDDAIAVLVNAPDAQLTLYGYSVEHLAMIASVMQTENVSARDVVYILQDVGEIAKRVMDAMRKSTEEARHTEKEQAYMDGYAEGRHALYKEICELMGHA